MPGIRTLRRTTTTTALLALALTVTAVGSASASRSPSSGPLPASVPARGGSPESAVDRVAHFFGAYVDTAHDANDGRLTDDLRRHYLTSDLRTRLASWESKHGVDGVLRSKPAPIAWQVMYNDSGMGHTWTRVRLTWGTDVHPTHTFLSVQSDLATMLISGIEEATTQ
ncbi:hypothetical protein ABZ769_11125 [Streptomyces olivoreticuli]